ncbi:MAG: hypothetical protein HN368_12835 [Spirochaetales bacterium]|nr:hypothetical protein [Spirochaetales bacterium]
MAQIAFRIDRTMLSFAYTSTQIDRLLTPLYDPVIHRDTVDGTFDYLRKALSLRIPAELNPYILDAAVDGFNPEWFSRTSQRMLFNIHQVFTGREKTLSLPISINSFKNAFMESTRVDFDTEVYLEINREINRLPSALDLADEIPEDDLDRIIVNLGRVRMILTLLQYAVPVLFILLCFIFRRAGSGLAALGVGLFIGGTAIAVTVSSWSGYLGQVVSRAAAGAVPQFLRWVDYGLQESVSELLSGMLPVAIIVIVCGLLLSSAGVFLFIWKQDPEMRIPGGHS